MDGDEEPTNSIWIVRILLGRLIRERTFIGQAIKLFVKFQHREIMRGMVKLNDLEDMAEPPLHGSMRVLLENQRLQGGNDMDMDAGENWGAPSIGYFGPEGSHPGFCLSTFV